MSLATGGCEPVISRSVVLRLAGCATEIDENIIFVVDKK